MLERVSDREKTLLEWREWTKLEESGKEPDRKTLIEGEKTEEKEMVKRGGKMCKTTICEYDMKQFKK